MQIKAYFRSYSFRSGALIFLAFGLTLVAVRVSIYFHTVRNAKADIRLIIDAHAEDLNESIELYGTSYATNLVNDIIQGADDGRLYIALRTEGRVVGNFPAIPIALLGKPGWTEIVLEPGQGKPPLHLSVHSLFYPEGNALLVGYDLAFVDSIQQELPGTLFANIELALILAMLLSFLLIWLLNRHVKKFNYAFENVQRGNLGYRMSVKDEGDQFDHLASNLNRTLDWITTLLTTSRDLSNSLAHDLRTPLSRHRLGLRALSGNESLPAELKEQLDTSVMQLDELVEMFDNILTISTAETLSVTELFEDVHLNTLLEKILDFYEPIMEERHIELQSNLKDKEISIPGNRQLLGQAILNLVDNAIKYSPERGVIRVEIKRGKDGVSVIVADNGQGVPPEYLGKIKERFFRVDASRNTPGSGLGLSLVEAVAKLHHGRLQLENTFPGFMATLHLAVRSQ